MRPAIPFRWALWALICTPLVSCKAADVPFGSKKATRRDAGSSAPQHREAGAGAEAPARLSVGSQTTALPRACQPSAKRCDAFPEARPDRLSEHVTVYADDHLQMIVHGGTRSIPEACAVGGPVHYESQLWIYDDPCNRWLKRESPVARGRHYGAYGDGKLWLFGGRYRAPEETGAFTLYDDLWRYDVATDEWEQQAPVSTPGPRYGGQMVYDATRNRLWLYGGSTDTTGAYNPLDELWSYDITSSEWKRHRSANSPGGRLLFSMTADSQRDGLVVFGGIDESSFTAGAYYSDLWFFDLAAGDWSKLAPDRAGPAGRFFSGMAYAAALDAYILFGGHDDTMLGHRNETWLFDPAADPAAWVEFSHAGERKPAGDTQLNQARGLCDFPPDFTVIDAASPERRSAHSLIYSPTCGRVLLFGGKTDCGSIDDIWHFDLRTGWERREAAREGEACLRWRKEASSCGDLCF